MIVRVEFVGFRGVVPESEIEVAVGEKAHLRCLVDRLSEAYGTALLDYILLPSGEQHPGVAVLINGVNSHLRKGLSTELRAGDNVVFMPVIGGGSR